MYSLLCTFYNAESTLHSKAQKDDLSTNNGLFCGFSIALLRYLQTWWSEKYLCLPERILLLRRIRQATNWLVKIFWEKTANIFVWQSGLRDIFGRPYQARRTREKVDYKCQPTWHNKEWERQVGFKMLQNNDPGPPWNIIIMLKRWTTVWYLT